jgi:FkbM family methyltransferase
MLFSEMTHKWKHAVRHSGTSLKGFLAILFEKPRFAAKLLQGRFYYFWNRQLKEPISTPDGYSIETSTELISYWSLKVEKECFRASWTKSLKLELAPLVVDVGANAGVFTHLLWSLKPDTEIIAFEPLPKMNLKIQEWARRTRANLKLFKSAVSDHSGIATFCAEADNDTSASLQLANDHRQGFQVKVVTLDSALPNRPIFLIKIDVEGFEPEVLSGAQKTLQNTRFLLIEAHSKPAHAKLVEKLGPEWLSEQVGSSDYFFRRTNDFNL